MVKFVFFFFSKNACRRNAVGSFSGNIDEMVSIKIIFQQIKLYQLRNSNLVLKVFLSLTPPELLDVQT